MILIATLMFLALGMGCVTMAILRWSSEYDEIEEELQRQAKEGLERRDAEKNGDV